MLKKFFLNKNIKFKCFVIAMDSELNPILEMINPYEKFEYLNRVFYTKNDILITKSGIGEINAATATEALINLLEGKENIDCIINVGLCGSFNKKDHKIGDIFMVKDVVHYDFDLSAINGTKVGQYPEYEKNYFEADISYFQALQKIYNDKIKLVRCASGDKFIADKNFQEYIINNFEADICEMESAGIIITAKKHNIPTIFIKAISDIVQDENSQDDFNKSTKNIVYNYLEVIKLIIENKLTKRIPSFNIDHNKLDIGFYTSRIDGDIFTYDLRFKIPNNDDFIPVDAMHTVEHQMATFLRNSYAKDNIIYFGAMACGTGFYLLLRNIDYKEAKILTEEALEKTISSNEIFGSTKIECGNSKNHNLELAKTLCKKYLEEIKEKNFFKYEEKNEL